METEWVDMLQTVGDLEGIIIIGIIPWELQWQLQAKVKVCSKLVVGGGGRTRTY